MTLSGRHPWTVAELGLSLVASGDTAGAHTMCDELIHRSRDEHGAPVYVAALLGALGDTDEAFAFLERGYRTRDSWCIHLNRAPHFDPLRADPRFHAASVRRDGTPRGRRPRARAEAPRQGTGRSRGPRRPGAPPGASVSPWTYADDVRPREVGPLDSTVDAAEQRRATGRGGGRGKRADQGELARRTTTPGRSAGPASAGLRASTSGSAPGPEAAVHRECEPGARCGHAWFDTFDHAWLLRFLEPRVADRRGQRSPSRASVLRPPTSAWRSHPRWEPDAVVPHVRICGRGAQQWAFLLRPRRRLRANPAAFPSLLSAIVLPARPARESARHRGYPGTSSSLRGRRTRRRGSHSPARCTRHSMARSRLSGRRP